MRTELHHIIQAAQEGDRAAGFALLRHVTRSGDPTGLLLGLAAAARPDQRRRALSLTCAWWGKPYAAHRARTVLPHKWRLKHQPQALAREVDAQARWLWFARDADGYDVERWLGWNAQTCAAPASALADAVALAMPATDRWPPHVLRLPVYWRLPLQEGRPFPPLRLVRALPLRDSDAAQLSHPDLNRVEHLQWVLGDGWSTPFPRRVEALAALAATPLPHLKTLRIRWRRSRYSTTPNPDFSALAAAPWMAHLERLHIHTFAMREDPPEDKLVRALCERAPPALRELSLPGSRLSPRAAADLNSDPWLGQLTRVSLYVWWLTNAQARDTFAGNAALIARLPSHHRRAVEAALRGERTLWQG
jgi:hypothetical protein